MLTHKDWTKGVPADNKYQTELLHMLKHVLKILIGSDNVDSVFCTSSNCVCLFSWHIYCNTIMIYIWQGAMIRDFRDVPCPCQIEIEMGLWGIEYDHLKGWKISLESVYISIIPPIIPCIYYLDLTLLNTNTFYK